MSQSHPPLSNAGVIGLVAKREISSRLKDKGFLISSVVIVVLILGSVLLQVVLQSGSDTVNIGYSGGPQGIGQALEAQADALGTDADVQEFDDETAATQAVEDEDVDAVLVDGEQVIVAENLEGLTRGIFEGAVTSLNLARELADADVDPQVLQPVSLDVTALEGSSDGNQEQVLVALVAVLLLYTLLVFFGQFIAQGVVEEKASRVIEVLLATVRPWQLLAGKIIGLGVLALGQLIIICVVGLGGAIAFDVVTVPGAAIGTVLMVIGWFVLGFAFVASMFAVAGALVTRQEDLQTVVLPATMLLVGALVFAFTAIQNPDGTLARITSFIPPISTMVMPIRIAAGTVAWWEIVAAIVLMLIAIAAIIRVGGRIYSGALLRQGGRVKVKDALRAERAG